MQPIWSICSILSPTVLLFYRWSYWRSNSLDIISRRILVSAANQNAEELFKKTVEVDRLIDMMKDADDNEVSIVCIDVFSYDSWRITQMIIK